MKRRFGEEQIIAIPREQEAGSPVKEVTRTARHIGAVVLPLEGEIRRDGDLGRAGGGAVWSCSVDDGRMGPAVVPEWQCRPAAARRDCRSHRIDAHAEEFLGLVNDRPDMARPPRKTA